MQNSNSNPNSNPNGNGESWDVSSLPRIWEKFSYLRKLENEAASLSKASMDPVTSVSRAWMLGGKLSMDFTPELNQLARKAAEIPALSPKEANFKAEMLSHLIEKSGDPATIALAKSLKRDLKSALK